MSILLGIGVVAVVIGLEFNAIKRWDGIWRWLAAAPLALMAADAVWIWLDLAKDPTSHNLWPLELMLVGAAGLPIVGFLWLARQVVKA